MSPFVIRETNVHGTNWQPPAPAAEGSKPAAGDKPQNGFHFHDVLSVLNPLQYVPVVGTIYRAVTGDTIPEAARVAGSFLVGGLMGGPVGLLTTAATTALEEVTGVDPDKIGHAVLAGLGLIHDTPKPAPQPALAAPVLEPPALPPPALAAYGRSLGLLGHA